MEWEVRLIEWLQSNTGDIGMAFGKIFSFFGGESGLLLVFLLVLFCWKKEAGKRLGLIVVSVNVWLPMIKAVALRPRPYVTYPDRVEARVLVDADAAAQDVAAQGYSFPSMHAASVPPLYVSLAMEAKKKWMWITAIALMVLVGVSRVLVGMHYPTDVLAGWGVGFAAIGIFRLLELFVRKEWLRHLIVLCLTLPGLFYVRTQDYFTALGLLIGFITAIPFERKYTRFQDTRNIWAMLLRIVGAFALYFVLNTLLKLPFDKAFLDGGSLGAYLIRTVRYTVIMFLIIGVYPKIFPLFEKVGKKKQHFKEKYNQ